MPCFGIVWVWKPNLLHASHYTRLEVVIRIMSCSASCFCFAFKWMMMFWIEYVCTVSVPSFILTAGRWWMVPMRWYNWRATHHGQLGTQWQALWSACWGTSDGSTRFQFVLRASMVLKMRSSWACQHSLDPLVSLEYSTSLLLMKNARSSSNLLRHLQRFRLS